MFNIPNNVIYFQDSLNGIFGGYGLEENPNSKNLDRIDMYPIIYKTNSLGKEYEKIDLPKQILGNVHKLYFKDSVIFAQIDETIYKSNNLGKSWDKIFTGLIETYNLNFTNQNSFLSIIRGRKNKYLIRYENNKIDTIKTLDYKDYNLTNTNLYSWKEDKKDYKTNKLLIQNLKFENSYTINFKNPETIKYIFELEPKKSIIVNENSIIQYFENRTKTIYPKFYNKYYLKDFLANKNILIAICKEINSKNSITDDYYFISYDYGNNWKLLQVENGSNRTKFLYDNKMLISFDGGGLQYLIL